MGGTAQSALTPGNDSTRTGAGSQRHGPRSRSRSPVLARADKHPCQAVDRPDAEKRRRVDELAKVNYQSANVATGLFAEYVYPPKVGVRRDRLGNDVEVFGTELQSVEVEVRDGRPLGLNLDEHGVRLVGHDFLPIDYYSIDTVLDAYYPECCELVRAATGARKVIAFDHNLRSVGKRGCSMGGGFAVQAPLELVHGDYTEESACKRVRDMTQSPTKNDTLRRKLGDQPPIQEDADDLLGQRYMFINVWRSIHPEPIERKPLGILSPQSVPLEDVIVHEIHYADRIGENYNARHGSSHEWWAFPRMTRDEALLLKCWDSAGELAARAPQGVPRVPCTFAFHSALDMQVRPGAPDRESIEVRTIAFF